MALMRVVGLSPARHWQRHRRRQRVAEVAHVFSNPLDCCVCPVARVHYLSQHDDPSHPNSVMVVVDAAEPKAIWCRT